MKILTLISLFLSLYCLSASQSLVKNYPDIYNRIVEIDNTDDLDTVVVRPSLLEDFQTCDGIYVAGLYDNDTKLRKIEVVVYKSLGQQYYYYYLNNGVLEIVIDEFKRYYYDIDKGDFDRQRFDGGFHGTYLFKDRKLIDLISTGHNRYEDTENFPIEETLNAEFDCYMGKLNKERNASRE